MRFYMFMWTKYMERTSHIGYFLSFKKKKRKKQKEKKIKTRNKYLSTFVCWRDKTMPLKSENQFCCLKNIDSAREVMANIQAYEKRD